MPTTLLIGIVLILLGVSFAFKFVRACVLGKLDYWSGFLPFSIISPFFVHTVAPPPPLPSHAKVKDKLADKGKRSLVKEVSGIWIHTVVGPIFLVVSVLLLTAGFDLVGLPGSDTLNFIMNGGNPTAPRAVVYDKRYTFKFPILERSMKKVGRKMNHAQIPLPNDQRIIDTPEIRADEARRQAESERTD